MARMKFLCDAERCIECNACVTACKNANDVEWGIQRRRVVATAVFEQADQLAHLGIVRARIYYGWYGVHHRVYTCSAPWPRTDRCPAAEPAA